MQTSGVLSVDELRAKALHDFFCKWFRVNNAEEINPFIHRVQSHTLMREATVTLETQFVANANQGWQSLHKLCTNPEPRLPCPSPATRGVLLAANLNRLCINSIICRNVEHSNLTVPVGIRMSKQHQALSKVQMGDETDHAIKAAGGVPGIFLLVLPDSPPQFDPAIGPIMESPLSNSFFNTFAPLVTHANLTNGVIQVPFEVCKEAGLPVSLEPPMPNDGFLKKISDPLAREEARLRFQQQIHASALKEGKHLNTSFFAIPFGHVLSWILRSEEAAANKGIKMYYFRVKNQQQNILFYLVSNNDFERMVHSFKHAFLDKVEFWSIDDLKFEAIPLAPVPPPLRGGGGVEEAKIKMRSYISYTVPPLNEQGQPLSQATIDNLIPTLPPSVPSPDSWQTND